MPARPFHEVPRRFTALAAALAIALAGCATTPATLGVGATPAAAYADIATGVPQVTTAQLEPGYWLARTSNPDAVLMPRAAIDAQNARLRSVDPSMNELAAFPATVDAGQLRGWIEKISSRPTRTFYDTQGRELSPAALDRYLAALALDRIPAATTPRYGLVVRRSPQRAFPTLDRWFSTREGTDIDRWQESAEFPGTPVVVLHTSRDGQWHFVASPRYKAWMQAADIALGTRDEVLGYAGTGGAHRVITGAKPRTVYNPDVTAVSELQLDMGMRYPLAAIEPGSRLHGQVSAYHWPLRLPVREADGTLAFADALLPRSADSAPDYLPMTRRNLVTQAFKFLGERYGWGHDYNGRDCSGFVAEVYRSMGAVLPRNTSDQARSPALDKTLFDAGSSKAQREAAIAALDVGDLVFIPGHVMMFLGRVDGRPYVIHDTSGGTMLMPDGSRRTLGLAGVVVTPLEPMQFGADASYIDRMTSIVRVHPRTH